MRFLKLFSLALCLSLTCASSTWANEAAPTTSHVFSGNIVFGAGGMSGRFLVFDDWVATKNYTLNTVIKHDAAIWVALIDPAAGDEPGVSVNWEKITDQPTGSGASITAGTANPTGGNDGDAYVQVDGSDEIQAIWRNASGTWTEYTIPAGGSGTGDITSVGTANNSGLAGGVDSGDADLSLSANNLPTGTAVATGDHVVYTDASDSHATKRITVDNFGPHLAGTGLDSTATGQLALDSGRTGARIQRCRWRCHGPGPSVGQFRYQARDSCDARHPFWHRWRWGRRNHGHGQSWRG